MQKIQFTYFRKIDFIFVKNAESARRSNPKVKVKWPHFTLEQT